MELTLYTDMDGFATLRGEWNDLLRRSRFDTIFLTWEWQTTWWACVGAARGPLYLLAAHEGERLVGIIPLYLTEGADGRSLQVVGCIEVSDYLDLIVEAGYEQAVYGAFLDWLDSPAAPAWDRLDLCNEPGASLAHSLLADMAAARGWSVAVMQDDVCPVVALPDTWDGYLEGLDKKQRHEIRRKMRKAERELPGYGVRYVTGGPDLMEQVHSFVALHKLSSDDKNAFMTDEMQSFFQAVASFSARQGWLQLAFLDVAGQPAATYFCFTYGPELLIYNSGFDLKTYPQYSPGWVLLANMFQQAISDGRARVDFLQGNEDYKYRFGGVDTPVYRTLIER